MEIPPPEILFARFRVPIICALIGIILVGAGILILSLASPEDKIEIISSEESQIGKEAIFVDIEGAVEKPGVYELPAGSRVEDLLIVAGGLSAQASRDWVEKSLNRAQKLIDGAKIYIPKQGENIKGMSITSSKSTTGTTSEGVVSINTASQSELEALWGIGPVTAQKIIENRPYQTVEELLTKKILKSNVYEQNYQKLTVF